MPLLLESDVVGAGQPLCQCWKGYPLPHYNPFLTPTSRFLLLKGHQNLVVWLPSVAPQFMSHLAICTSTYRLSSQAQASPPAIVARESDLTESAFLPNRISVDVLTRPNVVQFPSQHSYLHIGLITSAALYLSRVLPLFFFFFFAAFPGLPPRTVLEGHGPTAESTRARAHLSLPIAPLR